MRPGWLVLVMGCADVCPPPNASGGTDLEREAAEAEAEVFLNAMIPGICVPKLRLTNLRGSQLGKYTPTTRRVKVQKDRSLSDIRSTVRHELCHALQFQHDLDLAADTFNLALPLDVPDDERAGETFAYTCQLGPELLHLVGEVCPGDEPGSEIFPFIRDLFHEPEAVVDEEVAFLEVGRLGIGPLSASFSPTVAGGLRVEVEGAEPLVVDLITGSLTSDAATLTGPASVADRQLSLQVGLGANGAQVLRWIYMDVDGRTRAGCVNDGDVAFAFGGDVWSAKREGSDVVWGVWGR